MRAARCGEVPTRASTAKRTKPLPRPKPSALQRAPGSAPLPSSRTNARAARAAFTIGIWSGASLRPRPRPASRHRHGTWSLSRLSRPKTTRLWASCLRPTRSSSRLQGPSRLRSSRHTRARSRLPSQAGRVPTSLATAAGSARKRTSKERALRTPSGCARARGRDARFIALAVPMHPTRPSSLTWWRV